MGILGTSFGGPLGLGNLVRQKIFQIRIECTGTYDILVLRILAATALRTLGV
jgi:hypothetical protein